MQSHVARTLQGAIARGRVAHGYLLCGPRGTGKTTLARVLAMALNCERRGERPDGEPCGECISCTRIWSGSASLDVVEIDAASNRGVDDARDLRERAMYAPSGDDRFKVYIVDEAHMLTREAWNTLLKVLEEPPPRVVFVFATTEPQKIAQAAAPVLSRLQRFDLKRIGTTEIRDRLAHVLGAEKVDASEEALVMLARAADGSMRDALSLTDQALSLATGRLTADTVREALGLVPEDEYLALLRLIAERRAADVFPAVARLAEGGVDFGVLLAGLADTLRAQLAVSLGGSAPEMSESAAASLGALRESLPPSDVLRMLNAIAELEPRFKRSTQQRLLLETLLVRFALLDRSVALEDVLREIRDGGGSPPPAPGPGGSRRDAAAASRGEPRTSAAGREVRTAAGVPGTAGDVQRGVPSTQVSAARAVAPDQGASMMTAAAGAATAAAVTAASALAAAATTAATLVGSAASVASETATLVVSRTGAAPGLLGASGRPTPAGPMDVAPRAADASPLPAPVPLDLNRLVERWDDIVERVRAAGRGVLASALAEAIPTAVSRTGAITIQVDGAHEGAAEVVERALESSAEDLLAEVRREFTGVTKVALRRSEAPPAPGGARRLTEDALRADRMAKLRKRDPLLGKAIDVLDLELID